MERVFVLIHNSRKKSHKAESRLPYRRQLRKLINVVLGAISLAFSTGCADKGGEEPSDNRAELTFYTSCRVPESDHSVKSRAYGFDFEPHNIKEINDVNLKITRICLYAGYSGNENFNINCDATSWLKAEDISYKYDTESWRANYPIFWPLEPEDKLSFFAYTPNDLRFENILPDYGTSGPLKIKYITPQKAWQQADLCVASSFNKIRREGAVQLNFAHTMTRVLFKARHKGFIPGGYGIRIEEIKLNGLITTQPFIYNYPEVTSDGEHAITSWDPDEANQSRGYVVMDNIDREHACLSTEFLPSYIPSADGQTSTTIPDYMKITNEPAGIMLLIPQNMEGVNLEMKISFYNPESMAKVAQITRTFPLSGVLPPVSTVTYRCELETTDNDWCVLSVNGSITPWSDPVSDNPPIKIE